MAATASMFPSPSVESNNNGHISPINNPKRPPASFVSNSVTSFQTAPLPADSKPSSASNSSEESFVSQNTVNLPSKPSTSTTVSEQQQPAPIKTNGISSRQQNSYGSAGSASVPPLTSLSKTPIYTPPSPPPSASPTDERRFDFDRKDITDADPVSTSLSSNDYLGSSPKFTSALTDEPAEGLSLTLPNWSQPPVSDTTMLTTTTTTNISLSPSKKPKVPRASTLAALDSSLARKPSLEATAASITSTLSGNAAPTAAPYTRVTRASEDLGSEAGSPPRAPALQDVNYLHPSSAVSTSGAYVRPTRRNTTGTLAGPSTRTSGRQNPHQVATPGQPMVGFPSTYAMEDASGHPLDSDILKEAEQIRAERRAKAQQEAEAALTMASGAKVKEERFSSADDKPAMGHIIGEDHVNYVLMYNMLTGIRVAVSRCQAKIKHPLADEDYTARHKYSFDIIGNELTPSAKYDFKFKDYAPFVFRELREDYFRLDPADYLLSLTAKYILSELGSPGKSGSFFYFSRDYRFIIKTIHYNEHKYLRSILKDYYNHVKTNPHTLLSRFYGLHRVKLPRGRKIHFVIMNNLFPPHRDIHETYDLKGSTVGREYPEAKAANNPGAVLKDLNWINREKQLELGPEKRALLTEQIRRDAEFLKSIGVMDYSLLVGIHNIKRGNRDNLRSNTLKVFSPAVPTRKATLSQGRSNAGAVRRAMRESDPKALGTSVEAKLPEADPENNRQYIFYQDEGGYRATDETNSPLPTIYYLGIIDILTPWTFFKRAENTWKGFKADRHKISPVPPLEYGDRFFSFLTAVMRGGEGGSRFKDE